MAGRRPTPTNLKLVTGNPGKRKLNDQEPEPDLLSDLSPPEWLSEGARAVWDREAPEQRKNLLLTVLDVTAFGRWCEDQAGYEGMLASIAVLRRQFAEATDAEQRQKLQAAMVNQQNWLSMYSKRLAAADREFGRTPAARAGLKVSPQGDLFGKSPEESYLTG